MADDDGRARRTAKKAAPARKAPAPKAAAPARKVPARKVPARKAAPVKQVTAKKAPARKAAPAPRAAARKAPTAEAGPGLLSPRPRKAAAFRPAAEQTFADDLPPAPAPEAPRDDPSARVRAVLRAAAVSLGQREATGAGAAPPPPPSPPPEEPAPQVLVAPAEEPEDEWVIVDDDFDDDEDDGYGTVATEVTELEEETEPEFEESDDLDQVTDEEEEDEEDEEWGIPEVMADDEPPPTRRRTLLATPPPAATPPPPPPPPLPVTEFRPEPAAAGKRGGAGGSVLAILLAVVLPVIGAIVGLVLAARGRRKGAALAGLATVVSVLALVGWLAGAGVAGYVAWNDKGIDYSKLKVGDCFDSASSNEVRGVKVEPCSEPHNSEIFFIVEHPAGPQEPYPGKDALVQFAADACLGQPLTEYLGVPLEQSTLKDFEIVLQESAWEKGRRILVCGLDTGGQGDITGSVKGTRR